VFLAGEGLFDEAADGLGSYRFIWLFFSPVVDRFQ